MRFMIVVKANKDSEAGVLPDKEIVAAMGKFNDEMIKAGVMLAADGLHVSSKGARVKFSGGKRGVIDGPFALTNDLIAGFWIIQVQSKKHALEWASRIPFAEGEVEVRQAFEASDFPPEILAPEDAARERAWRDEQQQKGPRS